MTGWSAASDLLLKPWENTEKKEKWDATTELCNVQGKVKVIENSDGLSSSVEQRAKSVTQGHNFKNQGIKN